jgi:hypothetical protein
MEENHIPENEQGLKQGTAALINERDRLKRERDEAFQHIITLKARIRKVLKLIEQAPETELEKSDKDVVEQICQVFADYGEANKRTVLIEFDRPAQADRFMEEFRHGLSHQYDTARQHADSKGWGDKFAKDFYYDEKRLIITGQ